MPTDKDSQMSAQSQGETQRIKSSRLAKNGRDEMALLVTLGGLSRSGRSLVQAESRWRRPDVIAGWDQPQPKIVVSRWNGSDLREQTSEITGDYHVLSVCLQPS